jgi:hypothetical protein
MARNLFLQLKKYSGSIISQDENYATEALATLLEEFPSFRASLIRELFNIEIEPEATVRTQVPYKTGQFGRAVLDLVLEDRSSFVVVEVKVESGLNYYEPKVQIEQNNYDQISAYPVSKYEADQIRKYEDCEGFPINKRISIFTLSKYPLNLRASDYKYFKKEVLWTTLFAKTENYYRSLTSETAEKYLLDKFMYYLKEEGMAGFQGFKIHHLADLFRRAELDAVCAEHQSLIQRNIAIPHFDARVQVDYGRDGVIYRWEHDKDIKVFAGLWLSDEIYYLKFPRETGPQVMVFFELPPKHKLRDSLTSCAAYAKVSKEFGRQEEGWQLLLRRKPLIEFLGSNDQSNSLLEFYTESITDLLQSGFLAELTARKE